MIASGGIAVIASAAKQSSRRGGKKAALDCRVASLLAMTVNNASQTGVITL
jgi:hypothetical protein